jgi:hypothetical protein
MKRFLIFLFLFALAIPSYAQEWQEARLWPYVAGTVAGGGCTTEALSEMGAQVAADPWAQYSVNEYSATQFTATSSFTLCKFDVVLCKTATPSAEMIAYIYSDSGSNNLGTLLGTSDNTINSSTLATCLSESTITFTGFNVSIVDTNIYWIVIYHPAASETSYPRWSCDTFAGFVKSGTPPTLSETSQDRTGKFRLYK